jgi:enoyl-CoA hydratase/carnithine racemase
MASIAAERSGDTLILRLDRPPVNALDVDTLDELSDCLDEAERSDVSALVVTATGPVFSAGADLWRVLEGDAAYIDTGIVALSRCFKSLFTFPRPLVAAVNGHALAGGCIIAAACDRRVMSSTGGMIGAIELTAGVPFPAWALEVLRFSVDNTYFQEIVYFGRGYKPEDALARGIIDEVVPAGELMDRALEIAGRLARIPPQTFSLTKAAMRRPTVEAADARAAATDEEVKAAWRSPEVHSAIREQLERLGASG